MYMNAIKPTSVFSNLNFHPATFEKSCLVAHTTQTVVLIDLLLQNSSK